MIGFGDSVIHYFNVWHLWRVAFEFDPVPCIQFFKRKKSLKPAWPKKRHKFWHWPLVDDGRIAEVYDHVHKCAYWHSVDITEITLQIYHEYRTSKKHISHVFCHDMCAALRHTWSYWWYLHINWQQKCLNDMSMTYMKNENWVLFSKVFVVVMSYHHRFSVEDSKCNSEKAASASTVWQWRPQKGSSSTGFRVIAALPTTTLAWLWLGSGHSMTNRIEKSNAHTSNLLPPELDDDGDHTTLKTAS